MNRLTLQEPLLSNATGPVDFRVTSAPALMAVSGAGTLKSWDGTAWDAGIAFTESQTITAPGWYQITLDAAGNAAVEESKDD